MRGSVAHEYEGCSVLCGGIKAVIACFLHRFRRDGFRNGLLVVVDSRGVLADLAQEGLRDADGLKVALHCVDSGGELVILGAVHQVCGLDHQVLNAVLFGAGQGLVDVVDGLVVAGLDMVDDDLGGEGSADGPVRIRRFQGCLDAADIGRAALVEGCAEAHDQELVLADVVAVAGIIRRGVAGVAAEIIGIRFLAFDHGLLLIGQGIPCRPCRRDIRVGCLCALLHIDGVDQGRALSRQLLVGLCDLAGCRCGRRRCRVCRGSSIRLSGVACVFRSFLAAGLFLCLLCRALSGCGTAACTAAAAGQKSTCHDS